MDHNHTTTIQQALQQANQVLTDFMHNTRQVNHLAQAAEIMAQAINTNHKIITCGNGGSHCDAMHFAEELTGKFRAPRKPLPAIAISDPSHLSCTGNDYGFEAVFSRFIEALGQPGDVLLAISTSGNSENILQAAAMARQKNMAIIALTGHQGGKLTNQATIEINVPHKGYADRIQEMHIKIIHVLIELIEKMV